MELGCAGGQTSLKISAWEVFLAAYRQIGYILLAQLPLTQRERDSGKDSKWHSIDLA